MLPQLSPSSFALFSIRHSPFYIFFFYILYFFDFITTPTQKSLLLGDIA